jgi:ATP synthase protein I
VQEVIANLQIASVCSFRQLDQRGFSRSSKTPFGRSSRNGTKTIDESTRKRCLLDYKKNRDWIENLTIVMQLGLTMAGCIVFCFFVGHGLDKWLGLRGVFAIIFILLGVAGGANVCYRQIIDVTDPKKKEDPDDHGNTSS